MREGEREREGGREGGGERERERERIMTNMSYDSLCIRPYLSAGLSTLNFP